ncbi:MAG: amidohydrolase [Verrucomicrobia bacterium]|nr:amidohydrolase [Verrucomicrobiota bacterium]
MRLSEIAGVCCAGFAFLLASIRLPAGEVRNEAGPASLILCNGKIWTVDRNRPVAQAVALRGSKILKVGGDAEILALKGSGTEVIDLHGRLVLPGFNDAHTHFENAVGWFFQVMVMAVNDQADLLGQLRAATDRVPPGMWITGGDWSTFAWQAAQKKNLPGWQGLVPDLAAVDAVTPHHPVLLRRFDRRYFINTAGMALAAIGEASGAGYERDPATGRLTGMLGSAAGELVEKLLPPDTRAKKLVGARGVLREFNRVGLTSIQDIARIDEISQRQLFPMFVERSYSDVGIYRDLIRTGELTVRVHALTPLETWADLAGVGIGPGSGDAFLSFGALKDFVDGSLMFAPVEGKTGSFTFRFKGEAAMQRNITAADRAGFDIGIHVLGDKALHLLLNWYEAAVAANGPRDRRFRMIHAWYASPEDLARAGKLRLIADVTPHQLLDQGVGALESKLGAERAKSAFAWRTMIEQGVRVDLVSDLPGLFNKTAISPFDPLKNIYSAITRKDPAHPDGPAFHPEQCLTIEEAIEAYTINPAYASREENRKGSITAGKLADLVVLSRDILTSKPEEILRTRVVCTIFDGKVVYRAP